jgi:hypothetical protein
LLPAVAAAVARVYLLRQAVLVVEPPEVPERPKPHRVVPVAAVELNLQAELRGPATAPSRPQVREPQERVGLVVLRTLAMPVVVVVVVTTAVAAAAHPLALEMRVAAAVAVAVTCRELQRRSRRAVALPAQIRRTQILSADEGVVPRLSAETDFL